MGTLLDWWTNPGHWSPKRRPCIHCAEPTNLLDAARRPAHKVCVEQLIDQLRHQEASS